MPYFLYRNRCSGNSIDGGQAEYFRIPFASTTLVHTPDIIDKKLLVLMADIFPTGYYCASRYLNPQQQQQHGNTKTG